MGLTRKKCEIHKKSISQKRYLNFQKKISHLLDNFMTNAMVYSAISVRWFFDLKSGPEILIFLKNFIFPSKSLENKL